MNSTIRLTLFLVALAVTLSGCTEATRVKVKGRLVERGNPFQVTSEGLPPGEMGIHVTFYPLRDDGTPGTPEEALVHPEDGTFEVLGRDHRGIPPGKYRITLFRGARGQMDRWRELFSYENSQITREVKDDSEIVIDVSSRTG